jgi:GNAT superfamily N-acetyltransferase
MPALTFAHEPARDGLPHRITARLDGRVVGWLDWMDARTGARPSTITHVEVAPTFRRLGIASAMLRRARDIDPDLRHSDSRTADGQAWIAAQDR